MYENGKTHRIGEKIVKKTEEISIKREEKKLKAEKANKNPYRFISWFFFLGLLCLGTAASAVTSDTNNDIMLGAFILFILANIISRFFTFWVAEKRSLKSYILKILGYMFGITVTIMLITFLPSMADDKEKMLDSISISEDGGVIYDIDESSLKTEWGKENHKYLTTLSSELNLFNDKMLEFDSLMYAENLLQSKVGIEESLRIHKNTLEFIENERVKISEITKNDAEAMNALNNTFDSISKVYSTSFEVYKFYNDYYDKIDWLADPIEIPEDVYDEYEMLYGLFNSAVEANEKRVQQGISKINQE